VLFGVLVGVVPPETVNDPLVAWSAGSPSLNMKSVNVNAVLPPAAPTTVKFSVSNVPLPLRGSALKAAMEIWPALFVLAVTLQLLLNVPVAVGALAVNTAAL
jgi:hypothetical protein